MDSISISLAFIAGVASFVSPCVIPLVPSYIGFIAPSASANNKSLRITDRPVFRTLAFVLGFTLVFAALGYVFTATTLGFSQFGFWIRILSSGIVLLFAFNLLFNFIPFLNYEMKAHVSKRPTNIGGAVLVGMAFGAGWTPCIGPILASILFFAASSGNPVLGIAYLGIYGLGLGLPFILLSIGFERYKPIITWLKTHRLLIKYGSFILLVIMAGLIFFDQTTTLAAWLPQAGYALSQWNQNNPDASFSIGMIGIFILGIPGVAKIILNFTKKPKVLKPGIIIYTLFIVVVFLGQSLEWWNFIEVVARYLSFQGI